MWVFGAAIDRGFPYRYDHFAGRVHMAGSRALIGADRLCCFHRGKKDVSAPPAASASRLGVSNGEIGFGRVPPQHVVLGNAVLSHF